MRSRDGILIGPSAVFHYSSLLFFNTAKSKSRPSDVHVAIKRPIFFPFDSRRHSMLVLAHSIRDLHILVRIFT